MAPLRDPRKWAWYIGRSTGEILHRAAERTIRSTGEKPYFREAASAVHKFMNRESLGTRRTRWVLGRIMVDTAVKNTRLSKALMPQELKRLKELCHQLFIVTPHEMEKMKDARKAAGHGQARQAALLQQIKTITKRKHAAFIREIKSFAPIMREYHLFGTEE